MAAHLEVVVSTVACSAQSIDSSRAYGLQRPVQQSRSTMLQILRVARHRVQPSRFRDILTQHHSHLAGKGDYGSK